MPGLLIVNRWDSRCGECGKSCDPSAKTHDIVYGYGSDNGSPGCGAEWDRLASDYVGAGIEAAAQALRPDLEWSPLF